MPKRFYKASVGLPVYNGEKYLEQTLKSIQSQTLENIEILISDNASTDRTAEIVQDYASSDKRIIFHIQSENVGAALNYNYVFRHTHGEYFRWAPADDVMCPELMEQCINLLETEPKYSLVYPKTELIDSKGEHIKFYDDNLHLVYPSAHKRACAYISRINLCNAVLGVHRRESLMETKLIQPFIGSDAVLLFGIALNGTIYELNKPLFKRRVHKEASHEANLTTRELQAWFDPKLQWKRKLLSTRRRILFEYLKLIMASNHATIYKMMVALSVYGVWEYRTIRSDVGRSRRQLGLKKSNTIALKSDRFGDMQKYLSK